MIARKRKPSGEPSTAPAVTLAGAERIRLPEGATRSLAGLPAILLSLALHAAPVVVLGYGWSQRPPVSAGEEVIDLDLVVAEEDNTPTTPVDAPEAPPEKEVLPPSIEAAQAPDRKEKELSEKEEAAELRLPDDKPDPKLNPAEQKVISLANNTAPLAASEPVRATADARFSAQVARHLARFRRFPGRLTGAQRAGRVVVRFALDEAGHITEVALVQPSGVAAFDSEALAMVRRADPFPRAPGGTAANFTIPVTYRLKD